MIVNGQEKTLPKPVTVQEYLEENGYQIARVALEKNGAIVPKASFAETMLDDRDTIEIVSFVGGG